MPTSGRDLRVASARVEPDRTGDSGCGWGRHRQQPWTILDDYDRASVAADCVCLTVVQGQLQLLGWRRDTEPERGRWALPGVFVNYIEEPAVAADRALRTKACVGDAPPSILPGSVPSLSPDPRLVGVVNDALRDERGWVLSLVHLVLISSEAAQDAVQRGAGSVALLPVVAPPSELPELAHVRIIGPDGRVGLALGHDQLVAISLDWLRERVTRLPFHLELLPTRFTLSEAQVVHEALLGRSVNKDSFRRMVTETRGWVHPTGEHRPVVGRRVAELYEARGAS